MGRIEETGVGRSLLGLAATLESWILLGRREEHEVWEVSSGLLRAHGIMDFAWEA